MLNYNSLIFLLGTVLALGTEFSHACFNLNQDLSYKPYSSYIESNKRISLVRLTSKSAIGSQNDYEAFIRDKEVLASEIYSDSAVSPSRGIIYEFAVLEDLKGHGRKKIYFYIDERESGYVEDSDFNGHSDFKFWKDRGGRLRYGSDCDLDYNFVRGSRYLALLGGEYGVKSFETVNDEKDEWYLEVKNKLRYIRLRDARIRSNQN